MKEMTTDVMCDLIADVYNHNKQDLMTLPVEQLRPLAQCAKAYCCVRESLKTTRPFLYFLRRLGMTLAGLPIMLISVFTPKMTLEDCKKLAADDRLVDKMMHIPGYAAYKTLKMLFLMFRLLEAVKKG